MYVYMLAVIYTYTYILNAVCGLKSAHARGEASKVELIKLVLVLMRE